MPRSGSGIYSKPTGTTATPNTTIQSSQFNATIDDLVADANAARPISAGGTGATTAAQARANLLVAQAQSNTTDETAGRGLIVGAGGLLTNAPTIAATDLNNVTTGLYWAVNTTVGVTNLPVARSGLLTVQRRADGRIWQSYQVILENQAPDIYVRQFAGTAWTGWQQLVGVAEAGSIDLGVRGAIRYEKYSDGVQIAYGFISDLNISTPTAFFGQRRSLTQTVSWSPLTWTFDPRVVVSVRQGSAPGVVVMTETPTEFTYAYVSTSDAIPPEDRSITFHARGRWK